MTTNIIPQLERMLDFHQQHLSNLQNLRKRGVELTHLPPEGNTDNEVKGMDDIIRHEITAVENLQRAINALRSGNA